MLNMKNAACHPGFEVHAIMPLGPRGHYRGNLSYVKIMSVPNF